MKEIPKDYMSKNIVNLCFPNIILSSTNIISTRRGKVLKLMEAGLKLHMKSL